MSFKVSLSIAIRDEADHVSGTKRKKRGDIISIKKYSTEHGPGTLKQYLIINLELPNVAKKKIHRLASSHIEGGFWNQPAPNLGLPKIPTANKRMFSIPHTMFQNRFPALYASVNWSRVMDPEDDYQPWLNRVFSLTGSQTNFIYSKIKGRLMTQQDAEDVLV